MAGQFELEEQYWRALLQDDEATATEEARARSEGDGQSEPRSGTLMQRPLDALWEAARQACDGDVALDVQVTGFNRGGLLVDWSGLHGFVPASHILNMPSITDDELRRAEFERRVGHAIKGKIIELDRAHGRFVLSERLAYNDRARVEILLNEMQAGQKRCGVVTTVCDFGAFIDLGGVEGLAHISEISWGRINHPSDMLHSGQSVDVYVMSIDREQRRIALSMKRLHPDPWVTVPVRYAPNQEVEGVVTTVVDFGAFVRLEEGVEGLIHISELAEGNFLHPRNVVRENETVRVRVLSIDVSHRRLGLSLRQVHHSNGSDAVAPSSQLEVV
jgi:small subunit ribosomal protein S1